MGIFWIPSGHNINVPLGDMLVADTQEVIPAPKGIRLTIDRAIVKDERGKLMTVSDWALARVIPKEGLPAVVPIRHGYVHLLLGEEDYIEHTRAITSDELRGADVRTLDLISRKQVRVFYVGIDRPSETGKQYRWNLDLADFIHAVTQCPPGEESVLKTTSPERDVTDESAAFFSKGGSSVQQMTGITYVKPRPASGKKGIAIIISKGLAWMILGRYCALALPDDAGRSVLDEYMGLFLGTGSNT